MGFCEASRFTFWWRRSVSLCSSCAGPSAAKAERLARRGNRQILWGVRSGVCSRPTRTSGPHRWLLNCCHVWRLPGLLCPMFTAGARHRIAGGLLHRPSIFLSLLASSRSARQKESAARLRVDCRPSCGPWVSRNRTRSCRRLPRSTSRPRRDSGIEVIVLE